MCVSVCSGAVALDGRIEPGDMILEVNGVSFENLSNDEAVRILRDVVQKSGSATLSSVVSVLGNMSQCQHAATNCQPVTVLTSFCLPTVSAHVSAPQGPLWLAEHFLRTTYHQIWPPMTYVEVKCHITAETVV